MLLLAGSAQFFAKADVGLTVHQNPDTGLVEIHTWKVRFKHIGKQGVAELTYDIVTGTYEEQEDPSENWEETIRNF